MKKPLIAFALFFSVLTGYNQAYLPLLVENNEWNVLCAGTTPYPYWDTVYSTMSYKISGDTLINAMQYKKVYSSDEEVPLNWNINCCMREDTTGLVWMRYLNESDEYLVYDFSINPGDTVILGHYDSVRMLVDSITVMSIEGNDHRKYWFTCLDNPYYDEYWIEGIGSSRGLTWSGSAMVVGGFYKLLCMSQEEGLYFMNPEYSSCYLNTVGVRETEPSPFRLYPNPARDILTIEYSSDLKPGSITINDIAGRMIMEFHPDQKSLDISSLPMGIYLLMITTGRDVFMKKIMVE